MLYLIYSSAPADNEPPYNPGYYDHQVGTNLLHLLQQTFPQDVALALPRGGYNHGGVGVYSAGPIGAQIRA